MRFKIVCCVAVPLVACAPIGERTRDVAVPIEVKVAVPVSCATLPERAALIAPQDIATAPTDDYLVRLLYADWIEARSRLAEAEAVVKACNPKGLGL